MAALRSVGCGEQRAERRQRTFHQNLTSKQIEDLDDTKHNFSLTQATVIWVSISDQSLLNLPAAASMIGSQGENE